MKLTSAQLRREARRSILCQLEATNERPRDILILRKPSALRASLRLSIYGSKCNKTGGVEEIDLVDWGEESAVHYVRTFFDLFDLWSADPAALVFGAYDKPAFVKRVKGLVKLAGLDGDFAGHSFRSGGACDLYAANVPLESIQKMGRWRSNAALLYLRCQEVTPLKIAHAFRLSSEYGFEFWNAGPNVTRMGGKISYSLTIIVVVIK